MWTHKPWNGRYLPAPLGTDERLRAYARWCNAVEGNTTFYAIPSRDVVASWARQVERDFRFLAKVPKVVTHERRFRGVETEVRAFLSAIEPLDSRLHAIWVQLPASFAPADVDELTTFLRRMPRGRRYAVEVRHPAFFDDSRAERALEDALDSVGAEWIPFDTTTLFAAPPSSDAERAAWSAKPRAARRTRALSDQPIVRYIGRDDPNTTAAGWATWVDVVAAWLRDGRSPTVFIHTPDNADALELARRFHADVQAIVPEIDDLPTPAPIGPATLF